MLRRLLSLIAFLMLPTMAFCALTAGRQATAATLVHSSGFDGVIFPAEMRTFQMDLPKGVRYWTPSESDVLVAEKELIPFLSRSNDARVKDILGRIKTYKRQYAGVLIAGHKFVYINLFCAASSYWTQREVVVSDGRYVLF